MGELEAIKNSPAPRTRESLIADLKQLGLKAGMTVIVHSSLSSLGWVCGGPVTVIQALIEVVTSQGTIVMPAHSGDYSDPVYWGNPPVPESWQKTIRKTMPAYNPLTTPSRGMGVIAENFRSWPGVIRSDHPTVSFAAWGCNAQIITEKHSLANSLGKKSPLARVYDLEGWVLLLGVGYNNNTSFHLAEYQTNAKPFQGGAPIIENSSRVWKTYSDIKFNDSVFEQLGKDYEAKYPVFKANVGSALCRLFPQKEAVDFAGNWLKEAKETLTVQNPGVRSQNSEV